MSLYFLGVYPIPYIALDLSLSTPGLVVYISVDNSPLKEKVHIFVPFLNVV